ncbi:MAG: hypothetical protein WA277_09875 [Nitrospirota bacterium]
MSEIVQLYGELLGIPDIQQVSANATGEPIYDPRWGIPEDEIVKCGSCDTVMNNNDLVMAVCPSCGKVISALAEIDWNGTNITQNNASLQSLREIIAELKNENINYQNGG